MKRLTVTYNGTALFDGDIEELVLTAIAAALVIYGGVFYGLTQADDDDPWYDQ